MDIQYIGEHLVPGMIGKGLIWISISTLLLSLFSYVWALKSKEKANRLEKFGNIFFITHFISLLGASGTLYYLIFNHYFEYSYVWQYSATDLPAKFLISCFWAGQEGSFLIWAFLQGFLGLILLKYAKDWRSWTMPIFAFGQLFLLSMVLGLDIFGISIGGSPFTLLREMPSNADVDLFKDPNYLMMITEGNGLNPLLENIWMIIHPPSLFLGYAVSLVPFSYAVASLFRKQYHSWIKPALPWTAASVLTLGFGILLGGRWAYESLTFGGFWAWDPVENASLVPWLFLVASLHLLLISFKRFHSYATTYLFSFMGWIFVVYATYLTRSGVLGETSVHAFGDSGKALQMLIFNGLFLVIPLLFLLINKRNFPKKDGDEVMSREFWMLIGSVIVVLSAFQVILTTSIPVINKVLGTGIAPPVDNVQFFNTWQLPFAVLVVTLIGASQYLTYGRNELKPFLKKMGFNAAISLLLAVIIALIDGITKVDHLVLLYFVLFAVVVSIDFIIRFIRKTTNIGSSLTHLGFALFILGVLLAFSNSQVISKNTSGIDLGKEEDNAQNLVLVKGISQPMGDYSVTYTSSEDVGRETFYQVEFTHKNSTSGKPDFMVHPSVNHNSRMGNVYNPDTKHFLNKDIYTFISFSQQTKGPSDTSGFVRSFLQEMNLHDTVIFAHSFIILDSIQASMKDENAENASLNATFSILNMKAGKMIASMNYRIVNGQLFRDDAIIDPLDIKLSFEGVSSDSRSIKVGVYEKKQDFIVIKAVIFPYMNVLWFGAIIMFTGLCYSIIRRVKNKHITDVNNPEREQNQPSNS